METASPENSPYWDGRSDIQQPVGRTTDVWSLGCVFSIAATYVVLGKQGVLQFSKLRQQAIYAADKNVSSDAFHDGRKTLPEVALWHTYLKDSARNTDAFTASVLRMVDDHMLVTADQRWESSKVCGEFKRLFEDQCERIKVPDRIEEMLRNIDLEAELHEEQSRGIKRVDQAGAQAKVPPGPSLPIITGDSKSRSELLKQEILITSQRRSSIPINSPLNLDAGQGNETDQGGFTKSEINRSRSARRRHKPSQTPSELNTIISTSTEDRDVREPVTYQQVREVLREHGMARGIKSRSFAGLLLKRQVSVRGKKIWETEEDKLEAFFKDRDIVSELVSRLVAHH